MKKPGYHSLAFLIFYSSIIEAIQNNHADLGIAWDGDFDRCFFFDENGRFIEGYYIVGLLAQSFLTQQPGSCVVYDPRLIWNTIEIAEASASRSIERRVFISVTAMSM